MEEDTWKKLENIMNLVEDFEKEIREEEIKEYKQERRRGKREH